MPGLSGCVNIAAIATAGLAGIQARSLRIFAVSLSRHWRILAPALIPNTRGERTMKIRIVLYAASLLALSGCGFVSAPLGQGAAYAGKGAVLGADKGIEYGKEAAIIVAETAKDVGEAAARGLKPDDGDKPPRGTLRPR